MKDKRIPYIDIFKGFLITFVIISHLIYYIRLENFDNHLFSLIEKLNIFLVCFFMPAFFLITGYCSNFNKNFKPFMLSNCRTLLVPALLLPVFNRLILFIWKQDYSIWADIFSFGFISQCGYLWFLPALFLSKLIYWLINHFFQNNLLKLLMMIFVLIIGLISVDLCDVKDSNYLNPFYYRNALCLSIFLFIGDYFKKLKYNLFNLKIFSLAVLLFFGYIFLAKLINIHIPGCTRNIYIGGFLYIPVYLFLSLLGSFIILGVSKYIYSNSILEFLGKNSLIVYAIHGVMVRISVNCIGFFIPAKDTLLSGLMLYTLTLSLTILLCFYSSKLFNASYLCWIVGKFNNK